MSSPQKIQLCEAELVGDGPLPEKDLLTAGRHDRVRVEYQEVGSTFASKTWCNNRFLKK